MENSGELFPGVISLHPTNVRLSVAPLGRRWERRPQPYIRDAAVTVDPSPPDAGCIGPQPSIHRSAFLFRDRSSQCAGLYLVEELLIATSAWRATLARSRGQRGDAS
jgi:hypothetical protein